MAIFVALIATLLLHEAVRIPVNLLANFGMVLQITLQLRMVVQVLLIINECRIFSELWGDIPVSVKESVKVGQFTAVSFISVEAPFCAHKRVGIVSEGVTNARILAQIAFKCRMVLEELLIVRQRRIFKKLLGNLTVNVQESIEAREITAVGVS